MLKDLILRNRSTRKYYPEVAISRDRLIELVDLGRLSASGSNRQPLKYYLSVESEKNNIIFRNIRLGGGTLESERPSAYIIILNDKEICPDKANLVDHGIAAQNILLGATEIGLAGCMIGMVNRKELQRALNIPERYEILLVLTIGKPKETFVIETFGPNTIDSRGWWDEQGVRHIPKRTLEEIIIG